MKLLRVIIAVFVCVLLASCNPPDFWTQDRFYVENLSADSVILVYHTIFRGNDIDTITHTNSMAPGERNILRCFSENDTVFIDVFSPKRAVEDMLFLSTHNDTMLYVFPIVDSTWIEESHTKLGSKWLYKYVAP